MAQPHPPDSQPPTPTGPRTRCIGIHGPRNAGKTCYLGCLYGQRVGETARVDFADGATIAYLKGIWTTLAAQQLPRPTGGEPTQLVLEVEEPAAGRAWPVELRDYPGRLVEPVAPGATTAEAQLSAGARKWLADCHAILIFLDASEPSLEQIDALGLLISDLRKRSANGYTLLRPLGLVLTKWDRVEPSLGGPGGEPERTRRFMEGHGLFRQICQKLNDEPDNLRVFPVSAFGGQMPDNRPPRRLSPHNLHAPLLWAARAADEVLFDQTREAARRHLQRRRKCCGVSIPWADYGRAIQTYSKFASDNWIQNGPVAEQVGQDVRQLVDQKRWRMARVLLLAVLAVALPVLVTGLAVGQADEQAYAQLTALRQAHPGAEEAGRRANEDRGYLKSLWPWLGFGHGDEVKNWLQADEAIAEELVDYQRATTDGARLEADNRLADAIATYRGFLKKYRGNAHAATLEGRVLDLLPALEDQNEYEALRVAAAAAGKQVEAVENADRLARGYLAGGRPQKAMKGDVERWVVWFAGLQNEKDCYIVVKSLTIPGDSDLDAKLGVTEPTVTVKMSGRSYSTVRFKGNVVVMNARLGPYRWQWRKPGSLRVRVEGYHPFWSDDRAERTVTDPGFIAAKAEGPFLIQDRKGKMVMVLLRCEDAVVPELPPYHR